MGTAAEVHEIVVVGQAVDGEQAVAMATELRPDLVILDVKMPRKDGIEAAGETRISARIVPSTRAMIAAQNVS